VKARDRLTGFTGIAVVRIKYPYSGDRYGVQSRVDKKGEIPDLRSVDGKDLEQIDPPPRKKKEKPEKEPPAGPHDHNAVMAR